MATGTLMHKVYIVSYHGVERARLKSAEISGFSKNATKRLITRKGKRRSESARDGVSQSGTRPTYARAQRVSAHPQNENTPAAREMSDYRRPERERQLRARMRNSPCDSVAAFKLHRVNDDSVSPRVRRVPRALALHAPRPSLWCARACAA